MVADDQGTLMVRPPGYRASGTAGSSDPRTRRSPNALTHEVSPVS